MTSALEGGRGVVEKWTRVLISCVIMYVTGGEGVQKSEIFMDVIDGSPLTNYCHLMCIWILGTAVTMCNFLFCCFYHELLI